MQELYGLMDWRNTKMKENGNSAKIHILVAMEREAENLGLPCSVIGIGAENLPNIDPDDTVINIGFCGANGITPGTIIAPSEAVSLETGERISLKPGFDCLHTPCYTAESFVKTPAFETGSVCDMELFKITRIPCRELYVLKIVSDNLNEEDCESFCGEESWTVIREMLKKKELVP